MSDRFESPVFHYTFAAHEPGIRVRPGAELRVVCPDSDNAFADGTLIPAGRRQAGPGLFEGNPMAGPIAVEGAQVGDTVAIDLLGIELDRASGQTGLAPGHGLLPGHLLVPSGVADEVGRVPRHLYRWVIDPQAGVARLENPLGNRSFAVPLDPFVGCIGVCPRYGQAISTLFAGTFGGNMDVPLYRPGATLYLPVWCDEALVMMGDIHAAQGHGEIIGGAIETSGVIHCRFDLHKGHAIPAPRLRTPAHLVAIASDGDIRSALQQAYAWLVDWVSGDCGLNRLDAYNLISQVGEAFMGNLVTTPYTVAAAVRIDRLPPIENRRPATNRNQ